MVDMSAKPRLSYEREDWIHWWQESPQPNREYQFSVTLKLTNTVYPNRVEFVPWMEVQAYESRHDHRWSGDDWNGNVNDALTSNVTIHSPQNHDSTVFVETTRTVVFSREPKAQLGARIEIEGVPSPIVGPSDYFYRNEEGEEYYLLVDGIRHPVEFHQLSGPYLSAFLWLSEGEHLLSVPENVEVTQGARYHCTDDNSRIEVNQFSLQAGTFSHTFGYVAQFLLRVDTADGNQTEMWIDAGSMVVVSADPSGLPPDVPLILRVFQFRGRFLEWTTDAWLPVVDLKSPTISLAMDQPVNFTATRRTEHSTMTVLMGLASAGLLGALSIASWSFHKRKLSMKLKSAPIDRIVLLQRLEALKASGAISEATYSRLRAEYENGKR
jgi:hypothetical protein